MIAQSVPFAARLLPLLAAEEVPSPARWEREYASGRWSYLGAIDELAHYSVIVGYYAFLKPGGSVLDVGCGEGILQTRLSPHGYCRYLGIDFAAGAIQRVAQRADPATEFRVADAASFTTNEKFDAIIFNESLYYFQDPVRVVERYMGFLASDGIIIVSMEVARNRVAIWNAIGTVLKAIDETTAFNSAGLRMDSQGAGQTDAGTLAGRTANGQANIPRHRRPEVRILMDPQRAPRSSRGVRQPTPGGGLLQLLL
jgi:SAM-dependent methyltransferase